MSSELGSPAVCHSQSVDNSCSPIALPGPLDLKRALEESSFNSWRLQWRVLTSVCHPPALSHCKTDPTRLPFQAGGMYYKQNRTDSIRINNWVEIVTLTWDWSGWFPVRWEEEELDSWAHVGWFYLTRIYRKSWPLLLSALLLVTEVGHH